MISIIIPAYNEAKYIKATLATLKACFGNYDDIEVIVVNNGSLDDTRNHVQQFSWAKVIDLPLPVTVAEARNIGVKHSSGDFLSFIDADILVSESWFNTLENYYRNNFDMPMISGYKVSISKHPSWIELNWFSCFKKSPSSYINSGNLICSKKVFNLIGGFDPKLRTGEDVDFCRRAMNHGVQINPDEKFRVYHEGYPKDLKSFFLREKWHGIGDLQSFSYFFRSKVALASFVIFALTIQVLLSLFFKAYGFALLSFTVIVSANLFSFFARFKVF
jgi:glycosyltransferase involved in cell wall biosynthesis